MTAEETWGGGRNGVTPAPDSCRRRAPASRDQCHRPRFVTSLNLRDNPHGIGAVILTLANKEIERQRAPETREPPSPESPRDQSPVPETRALPPSPESQGARGRLGPRHEKRSGPAAPPATRVAGGEWPGLVVLRLPHP